MKEEFNIFENADDEIISEISEQFQADKNEREKIFRMSEDMYKRKLNKKEHEEITVSGVEHYKPVWYKSVAAAVTGFLVVGAFIGAGWVMVDSNRNQNNSQLRTYRLHRSCRIDYQWCSARKNIAR